MKMTRESPRLAVREDVRPQDFLLKQLGGMSLLAGKRLKKIARMGRVRDPLRIN